MRWLRSMAREVYSLFVDDGSFAVALLAWIIVGAAALRFLRAGHWSGPVLFAGLAGILAESALRSSRRR